MEKVARTYLSVNYFATSRDNHSVIIVPHHSCFTILSQLHDIMRYLKNIKGYEMNTITKLTLSVGLGLAFLTTSAVADVKKGQKLYLKKLKAPCGFNGSEFARKHTQDQWEKIHEAGKFAAEVKKICPKAKIKAKYVPHLYDFSYEYASDSGVVPSC